MISLKKILTEITHNLGDIAPGELAWSHAESVAIDKEWENWRIESMNKINLLGWTKLSDLVTIEENDLDRDNDGLKFSGDPATKPIYGMKVIDEDDGYIYQMDLWVHNKKRVFEK